MSTPTRVTTTSTSKIVVEWSSLSSPNNGGSDITSYFLEWDAGTNGVTYTEIVGYSPVSNATSYEVTGNSTGLVSGASYKFRVTARNIFGWGPVSSVATIKASSKPSTVPSVSTTISSTNGNVVITWGAPSSNGETLL